MNHRLRRSLQIAGTVLVWLTFSHVSPIFGDDLKNFSCNDEATKKKLIEPPDWVKNGVGINVRWWKSLEDEDFRHLTTVVLANGRSAKLGKLVNSGEEGVVYCLDPDCKMVIKIPTKHTVRITNEMQNIEEHEDAGFHVPKTYNQLVRENIPYIVREFIEGETLQAIRDRGMSEEQIHRLAEFYVKQKRSGIFPECAVRGNVLWGTSQRDWILVDSGEPPSHDFGDPSKWPQAVFANHPALLEKFNRFVSNLD